MSKREILLILQLLICQQLEVQAQHKRNYYFGFSRMQCSHNYSVLLQEFNCSLRSSNNRTNMIDAYFLFNAPLNTFDIHAIIICHPKNLRRWTLFNVRTNGCEFLKIVHRQKFFGIFTKTLNKYMNVKEFKCPMKKHFNYTVTGFKYDENHFPSYVPEAQVQGLLYMFVDKKMFAYVSLWGYVRYYANIKG